MAGVTLQQEQAVLFLELGNAILGWSHIEFQLLHAAGSCMGEKANFKALAQMFYAVENFRSKVAMVDAAINNSSEGIAHLAVWIAVKTRVEAAAKARNKLAHYRLQTHAEGKVGRRAALVPAKAWNPPNRPPPGSLFIADVVLHRESFYEVAHGCARLVSLLNGWPWQPPAPAARGKHPTQILQLVRRNRAIFALPPKSSRD